MTGGPCPDENALVRFSTGRLSGVDLGSIEQHLDGCSACRTLIAQLASLHSKTMETPGPSVPPPALQGKVGRYQVERLLGGGGMGMVYAGRDRELNRVVAIKVLKTTGAAGNVEPRARLLREAQTMAKLSHPNLVPIFELGTDRGDDFLAMELIDGPTLDFWLREKKRTWREIVAVFLEAGRGLEAAHQAGVVHRDFKPANVMIGPDGRARVTDFGLARPRVPEADAGGPDAASIELTREGSLLGTPAYMSPEQLEGQVADVRSDQFGFCVALVEALVGHRPFAGRTPGELRSGMRAGSPPVFDLKPARLKKALLKGMSLSPDARFPSMTALLAELQAILQPPKLKLAPIGAALAALAAVAAVVVAFESRSPVPAPAAAIAVPAAVAQARTVALGVGESKTVALPTVQRVQSVDAAIVGVQIIGNQQVVITGRAPGRTELVLLTRASPHAEQQPVTWTVEVADDGGRNFALPAGETRTLAVPGLTTIENENQAIANARITGKDQVTIEGVAAGVTVLKTMVLGRVDPLVWRLEVTARPRTPMTLKTGEWVDLTIDNLARIAVGDSEIAEVSTLGNSRVRITAKRPGKTTLISWSSAVPPRDLVRAEWEITVEVAAATVWLMPGTQKVITVPGLQRVAIGDAAIADVKTIGNNQLLLIGGTAGVTTLLAWKLDGTREAFTVSVGRLQEKAVGSPPAKPPAAVPLEGTTGLTVGEQKVFTVPNMQRIAVGDSAIADVKTIGNNQLLVAGEGEGTTTLLIWKSDGQRLSSVLTVTAAPPVVPTEADPAELYTLIEGESQELSIPFIDTFEAEPEGVVDVHRVGRDTLEIAGATPGKAKVVVTQKNGARRTIEVHVQVGELEAKTLGLLAGEHKVLDLASIQRVAVADPAVLEVEAKGKRLMLFGKAKGRTTLEVWSAKGKRRAWDVSVRAP